MEYIFGDMLKKYRKEKGVTQGDLAERLNISVALVSHWERGTRYPMLDKVYDVAKILGMEPKDFV